MTFIARMCWKTRTAPANKLCEQERAQVLEVANSPEYRDLSPNQIVPLLAQKGRYVASESSFYRVLREENQLHHRQRAHLAGLAGLGFLMWRRRRVR